MCEDQAESPDGPFAYLDPMQLQTRLPAAGGYIGEYISFSPASFFYRGVAKPGADLISR